MGIPFIFGVGAPKTGSNSLAAALELLGFHAVHLGAKFFHLEPNWLNTVQKNIAAGICPVENIDCDAIVDWPIHEKFKELDKAIPNAKFILTYRPPHDCALSWVRMTSIQHRKYAPMIKNNGADYVSYRRRVELTTNHVDDVLRYFWGRPHKLLILDCRDADETKWELLTDFLSVPCPEKGTPYPHDFDHAKKQISPNVDVSEDV